MPLARRASKKWRTLVAPVSYRLAEDRDRLRDARNVFPIQGRLETRYGYSRFTSSAIDTGQVLSASFFKKTDGTRHLIVKIGTTLYSVNSAGTASSIKTGLSSDTKHRGITLNNRHIISVEDDGLFSYDGSTFTQLGQDPPSAPSVATTTGSLTDSTYQVAVTFYASGIGFETNQGSASSNVSTTSQGISVTDIPTTADNGLIDKVRVYLKDVTAGGEFLFVKEISLGTASTTITSDPTSTSTPPTKNAAPLTGGGKFLTKFDRKLVYAGNDTFRNDVFFSEQDLPDAFDDNGDSQIVIPIPGDGEITGLATGFYDNDNLAPYLVIFKKRSTTIYSEIGGGELSTISDESGDGIGCVSNETIKVRNGNVYFMSASGWRVISNGRFVESEGEPITLGNGDIDDIFRSDGYVYEVNRQQFENFFSVYYPELNQYMTWVAEGSNTSLSKTYAYTFGSKKENIIPGFFPQEFNIQFTAGCLGEDSNGDEVVFLGDGNGFIYQHSIRESRSDVDSDNTETAIDALAVKAFMSGEDMDASYNFRELIVDALASDDDVTARSFVNNDVSESETMTYSFPDPESGFVLDFSKLDVGTFSDGRGIRRARNDINRVGYNVSIGFYQSGIGKNIGLLRAQMDFSKNGNPN